MTVGVIIPARDAERYLAEAGPDPEALIPRGEKLYYGTEEALNIQWAAEELHPDLFPDLDIPAATKSFYQQFFGYQLSQDQVSSILHPTS